MGILNANRKIRKRTDTDVDSRVSIFHRERECTNEDSRSPKDNYIIIFWWEERKFPESSLVDLRIKNYFKDYLFRTSEH